MGSQHGHARRDDDVRRRVHGHACSRLPQSCNRKGLVMADLSVADVLENAASLLEPEGVWNCKHCAATAIWSGAGHFFGVKETRPAQIAFATHVGINQSELPYSIYRWSDAPERT